MILSDHYSTLRQRGESVALALLCLLFAPVATAQVFSLEEPAFEVLVKSADYELRSYRPMVVAEVFVQGDVTVRRQGRLPTRQGLHFSPGCQRTGGCRPKSR